MCKVYTGYHGTSEIEHGLCAKARGLSLRTGAQTMLYLSLVFISSKNDSVETFKVRRPYVYVNFSQTMIHTIPKLGIK